MPVDEIEKAFSVEDLRRPWGVGVIQPKPNFKEVLLLGGGLMAALVLLNMVISAFRTTPVDQSFFWGSMRRRQFGFH